MPPCISVNLGILCVLCGKNWDLAVEQEVPLIHRVG